MLRVLLSRVRATLRRSRLDDEIDDEFREHLAMLQERFVRNGMDPSEAFYAARRQFGGVTQVKEQLMERRTMPLAEDVARDVRYAARCRWRTQFFSANGLNVLGVPPLLGRVFNEADGPAGEQPQRVVVLTYRFWQRHFGGRPEAVGQTLYLNREPYTVIGVLPRQYFYTGPEILVPLHLTFDLNFPWSIQARLQPGLNPPIARQRL